MCVCGWFHAMMCRTIPGFAARTNSWSIFPAVLNRCLARSSCFRSFLPCGPGDRFFPIVFLGVERNGSSTNLRFPSVGGILAAALGLCALQQSSLVSHFDCIYCLIFWMANSHSHNAIRGRKQHCPRRRLVLGSRFCSHLAKRWQDPPCSSR